MQKRKKKLVYILPEYSPQIATHMYYNVELLKRAKDDLDIFLILERGVCPKSIRRTRVLGLQFLPLRAIELFFILLLLRVRGYKTFWSHYSFLGGIIAPVFGKSFYWNCGMAWLYSRNSLREYFFRLALRRSILVTGTAGMKELYSKHYALQKERVLVLPNWIDVERFSSWREKKNKARELLRIPDGKKVVFFLHHLSERKGADMIVPVAKKFTNDFSVLFLVAGSGPLDSSIKGANIKTIGAIKQSDVPLYMAAADVFFMPSREEGFPHVLLEAMAVGVPIVASRVGGVPEIVPKEIERFVVSGTPDDYCERIQWLLRDAQEADTISSIEQRHVMQFDISQVLIAFVDLVQK